MKASKLFIENISWKTSENNTYEYYISEPDKRTEFEHFVIQIRKHGYVVTMRGVSYICLDIGKYLYWTTWDEVDKTERINRMPK